MQRMTTNRIPELLRVACLALLLALAGCGPGTGGTGTGPISLTFTLGAVGTSPPGGTDFTPAPPAQCETGGCARLDLLLEDARVEITSGCARFLHEGTWTVDDAGLLVLRGTLETVTAAGITRVPATARLQFGGRDPAGSTQVVSTLLAADGRVLVGPVTLQRNMAAAPAATDCALR